MAFFNLIATPGLGKSKDVIKQAQTHYGQAELSINANPLNGNLFLQDFSKTFTTQGFQFDIGYQYCFVKNLRQNQMGFGVRNVRKISYLGNLWWFN